MRYIALPEGIPKIYHGVWISREAKFKMNLKALKYRLNKPRYQENPLPTDIKNVTCDNIDTFENQIQIGIFILNDNEILRRPKSEFTNNVYFFSMVFPSSQETCNIRCSGQRIRFHRSGALETDIGPIS